MRLYLILLSLLFMTAILYEFDGSFILSSQSEQSDTKRERRLKIIALALILISGLRTESGTDFPHYVRHYNMLAQWKESGSNFELGYNILNIVLSLFGFSHQWLFLVLACILVVLIMDGIKKYSVHAEMSFYFFVALYFYFSSFNIVRQFVAIPITFFAFRYIKSKNLLKYLACIFLATLFHYSAIIMFPVYFVANVRFSRKTHLLVFAIGVVAALFGKPLFSMIISLFPRYAVYFETPGGSAWCDLAVMVVTYLLLENVNDKVKGKQLHTIYENVMLGGIVFALLTFTNLSFARIIPYFYIFTILAIPYGLKHTKYGSIKRPWLVVSVCTMAYIICLYYLINNNAGVVPYM